MLISIEHSWPENLKALAYHYERAYMRVEWLTKKVKNCDTEAEFEELMDAKDRAEEECAAAKRAFIVARFNWQDEDSKRFYSRGNAEK